MKTFQDCKDDVAKHSYGVNWQAWIEDESLPKGRFVDEHYAIAAELYADQFRSSKTINTIYDIDVSELISKLNEAEQIMEKIKNHVS